MTKEEKTKLLIEALKEEKKNLSERNYNFNPIDHDVCIAYLESGTYSEDLELYELLEAAVNDFDCLCSDYNVK